MSKLERMRIQSTILVKLNSIQLTEILCLVCRILYNTKVQDKGIPTTFLRAAGTCP